MALPISAGEIFGVAKFAYDLWKSCKEFEGEFEQVGKELFALRTVVELVHIECQDPNSIINLVDNKEQTVRKQLGVYVGNCKQALKSVESLLKRYKAMNLWDRMAWSLSGHAEVSSLESNLSSFATQLDSYVQKLELKGLGLVNKNVILADKNISLRIGRLEELLEKHDGDGKAAVTDLMQERQKSGASQKDRTRSQNVMFDYVKEVCQGNNKKQRPQTPDPPQGRPNANGSRLGVPKEGKRALSTGGTSQSNGHATKIPPRPTKPKNPSFTLECWLIQKKSAQALFVTLELSEKEKQCRGQWKLRDMARQFNGSCKSDKLDGNHNLVKWVLEDRKKKEEDINYTWYPHAAKIERKGNDVLLGMGVEEQAMVIIKRQMTPSAQKIADEKTAAKAEKAAKKDNAEKAAANQKAVEAALKKEKKEQAAKIKALEKENAKLKTLKHGKANANASGGAAGSDENAKQPNQDKSELDSTKKGSKESASKLDEKNSKANGKAKEAKSAEDRSSKEHLRSGPNKKQGKEAVVSTGEESNPSTAITGAKATESRPAKKDNKKHNKPDIKSQDLIDGSSPKQRKGHKPAKKDKQKDNKPDTKAQELIDGSAPKQRKGHENTEIQNLMEENARLKAALEEARSEV